MPRVVPTKSTVVGSPGSWKTLSKDLLSEWITSHWCRGGSSNCATVLVSENMLLLRWDCSRQKLYLYGVFLIFRLSFQNN